MSARPALLRARLLLVAMALGLGVSVAAPADAHELAMTTARVTLRDEHLDVHLELDPVALLARVSAVEPKALAALDEAALEALSARAQGELGAGAALETDGKRVALSVRVFPPIPVLRALAAKRAASPEGHGELVPVELEGAGSAVGARQVALSLPPVLGEALVTFVQPTTRWIQPGNTAAFTVLAAPAELAPIAPPGSTRQPWLAGAAVVLAVAAALASFSQRRRRPAGSDASTAALPPSRLGWSSPRSAGDLP